MITFVVQGETPAKKNANKFNSRTRCVYKDRHYKEWYEGAVIQIMSQKARQQMLQPPVKITLTFVHGDLRTRDADNGTTSIFDLLKDCGVIPDDNWKIVRKHVVESSYEKNNAHCIVEIEPYE